MREVAYEERRVLTVDGKAVLQIRACRGMLQPDGTLRLLAYAGRRCLLSQAETGAASAGQNTTTKKRAALEPPAWKPEAAGFPAFSTFEIK